MNIFRKKTKLTDTDEKTLQALRQRVCWLESARIQGIITADEFDRGERQKLNLGHTIGHSVEANSNFTVSHGKAVAIGMAIVSRAAAKLSLCDPETATAIEAILMDFSLPTSTSDTASAIYEGALSDKKRFGTKVNLIVPSFIGNCVIHTVTTEELKTFIEAGL